MVRRDLVQFAAQVLDVGIDRAVGDDAIVRIHLAHQLVAGKNPAFIVTKRLEQTAFHWRQIQHLAIERG